MSETIIKDALDRLEKITDIDFLLSEEEKMIRDMVRKFVEVEILPDASRHFEEGTFPLDKARRLGSELGLFGAALPQEYGCAGVSAVAYGLANEELEYGGSGWRSMLSVQSGLVMYPIFECGSEEQKKKWLPKLAKGEVIGCFGLTEPDAGSDPGSMQTRVKSDGAGGYILNGAKAWITNGTIADLAVVWAKDEAGDVRGVLVEKGAPGYTTQDEKHKFSLRASVTSQLFFDNARVPAENVLPKATGLKYALKCLNQARYGISWGAVGSALFTLKQALTYALERHQFGKPLASFQLQQEKFAWMLTEIVKARHLCLWVGRLKDGVGPNGYSPLTHVHISLAKRNNVWMARECARMAREILGAYGISGEYPVWRHMADLESVYTYEGTHDIHTLILGEYLTGIPAFR